MPTKKSLSEISGHDVRHFIEHQLGQELPRSGLLAGQSVTSVVLYLMGRAKEVNVNDYDIFYWEIGEQRRVDNKPDPIVVLNKRVVTNLGQLRIKNEARFERYCQHRHRNKYFSDVMDISAVDSEYASLETLISILYQKMKREEGSSVRVENGKFFEMSSDPHVWLSPKTCGPDPVKMERAGVEAVMENRVQFLLNRFYSDHYMISSAHRKGMLNTIEVRGVGGERSNKLIGPGDGLSIIGGFDLNANQVGVCLTTGKIIYTSDFQEFVKSQQLRIVRLGRPWQSLIRYYRKKNQHGYYGNDDAEIRKVTATYAIKTGIGLHESIPWIKTELMALNNKGVSATLNMPRIGVNYRNELAGTPISKWTDVEKNTIKKLKGKNLDLFEVIPSSLPDCDITDGKMYENFYREYGNNATGFLAYAMGNIVPYLDVKYGHASKSRYISLGARVDSAMETDTPVGPTTSEPKERRADLSIVGQNLLVKGHVNEGDIALVAAYLRKHREMKRIIAGLDIATAKRVTEKVKKIEAQEPELAYGIFQYGEMMTPDYIIDTPIDQFRATLRKVEDEGGNKLRDRLIPIMTINGVTCREIVTQTGLSAEGQEMGHCVAGYGRRVGAMQSFIVSLRSQEGGKSTLELVVRFKEKDEARLKVGQHYGKFNGRPSQAHIDVVKELVERMGNVYDAYNDIKEKMSGLSKEPSSAEVLLTAFA